MGIGDLARATGTKVVTIRYYEQKGLLPIPPRTEGNYRVYNQGHARRLQFIRRCRDFGFSLSEVRELLLLSGQEGRECSEVARITAQHLSDIEQKIAGLALLADELRRINESCRCDGLIADCRIVEALSPNITSCSPDLVE